MPIVFHVYLTSINVIVSWGAQYCKMYSTNSVIHIVERRDGKLKGP